MLITEKTSKKDALTLENLNEGRGRGGGNQSDKTPRSYCSTLENGSTWVSGIDGTIWIRLFNKYRMTPNYLAPGCNPKGRLLPDGLFVPRLRAFRWFTDCPLQLLHQQLADVSNQAD